MKVLLIGNFAADQQFSMLGFFGTLKAGLTAQGHTVAVSIPTARVAASAFAKRKPGTQKWLAYIDKYALYPSVLRKTIQEEKPDIIHICDQGNGMYVPIIKDYPHLVTCHDLLAIRTMLGEIPENAIGGTGKFYQNLILKGLKQTKHFVCDSEITKEDTIRVVNTDAARNSALINLYSPYSPMPESERLPLLNKISAFQGKPFLLHVGGNQFYKNRLGLLKIYDALFRKMGHQTPELFMVGKTFSGAMRQQLETAPASAAHIHELSGLSNETLQALYSHAVALVFPSLYEGFGLPIVEAQSCGCPVFTSNRAPMTEIGKSVAVYFDPTQIDAAAATIEEHITRPGERERMGQAGIENVQKYFTIQKMVNEYTALYKSITGK